MKKIMIAGLLLLAVGITGCENYNDEGAVFNGGEKFNVRCINGVEYLMKHAAYQGYMTAHIDEETLMPKRCN